MGVRRPIIAVLVGLLLVAAAFGATALLRRSGTGARTIAGRRSPGDLSVGITTLDEVRARITSPGSLAWTGDELSIIGSAATKASDGATLAAASYDPATGAWREWPPWPYDQPVVNAQVVWAGERAIVAGVGCDAHPDDESLNCESTEIAVAVFDHAAFSWTKVHAPVSTTALNDEERTMGTCCIAMGWASGRAHFIIAGTVVGLDPVTTTWTNEPALPDGVMTTQFCELHDEIVAFARLQPSDVDPMKRVQPEMLSSTGWLSLAPLSVADSADLLGGVGVVCSPERLLAVSADWQRAWELSGSDEGWVQIPDPDVNLENPIEASVTTVLPPAHLPPELDAREWTGSAFVWWTGEQLTSLRGPDGSGRTATITQRGLGVTYRPATGDWANVVPGPKALGGPGQVAWRDDVGYMVVTVGDRLHLVAYRPA